jgi:Spy/CpxP family protein refolding chaperone
LKNIALVFGKEPTMKCHNALLLLTAAALMVFSPVAGSTDADLISGASQAAPYDSKRFSFGENGGPMSGWADELALTGQQRTDIQIIVADYMPRYRDLAKLGQETAAGLLSMAPDDPGYREATQQASATAAASAAELVILLGEMRGKLHAVLRDEQRLKFQELLRSRPHPPHDEDATP